MNNPFFWLGVSILLVAISLVALLTVAILTLQELARAARSAEKLLDTLHQALPATLRDIRLTGEDLSGLSDEVTCGVQSARNVVEQVDKGLTEAKVQAKKAHITTRSLFAGANAALKVLVGKPRRRRRPPTRRPPVQPIAEPNPKSNPTTSNTSEYSSSNSPNHSPNHSQNQSLSQKSHSSSAPVPSAPVPSAPVPDVPAPSTSGKSAANASPTAETETDSKIPASDDAELKL